ncbi:hypothetical protein L1887_26547 [Cichorium endivia]|nr:hypothetical protein L1887_26547 [Cichorium endivia]
MEEILLCCTLKGTLRSFLRLDLELHVNLVLMAEYESNHHNYYTPSETALQAINTIIQLHFEKTLEKKRAVDQQKKSYVGYWQFLIRAK